MYNIKFQDGTQLEKRESLRRILSEVQIVRNRLSAAFVLSIFSSGIMMTIPYFTGFIIDNAVTGSIPIQDITYYGHGYIII